MDKLKDDSDYKQLIEKIGGTYQNSKKKAVSAVNTEMLDAYWEIGKYIIEFEQEGNLQAEYGKTLLENLAKELSLRYGSGFNRSNLNSMKFGHDKYSVYEFMNFPENYQYTENELEKSIIDNLQQFLLELGKGFAFIGRQKRITLNNRHYFVDLVFYHVKLKCYVLIDLKIGEVAHEHIGQMKLYLGYYTKEVNEETDNEPIGLILSEEKDDIMVEYAMLNDTSKLIVSKYQLYLPDIEQLKSRILEIMDRE